MAQRLEHSSRSGACAGGAGRGLQYPVIYILVSATVKPTSRRRRGASSESSVASRCGAHRARSSTRCWVIVRDRLGALAPAQGRPTSRYATSSSVCAATLLTAVVRQESKASTQNTSSSSRADWTAVDTQHSATLHSSAFRQAVSMGAVARSQAAERCKSTIRWHTARLSQS